VHCGSCGRPLLPFHEACFQCGTTAQPSESAAARKREWDALSPKMQGEMRGAYDLQVERRERWLEWLRAHRRVHAALGAVLYGLPAAFIFGMLDGFPLWAIPFVSLVDLALGAGVGTALNRLQGGSYRGMILFGAAFLGEALLRVGGASLLGLGLGAAGVALILISGFLLSLCTGYAFGLQLTLDRSDAGA